MSVEGNGTFAINKSQTTNNCQLSISYAALTGLNCQLSQSWSSCKSYENHGSDKSARNDEPHS
jgi:hypothetical protein